MYRDLKLGLALGVLLVGSVAAFFFRNGGDPNVGLPKLEQPERLDAELAARAVAPYLGDLEAEPASALAAMIDDSDWAKPSPLFGTPRNVSAVSRTYVTPAPISLTPIAEPTPEDVVIPSMALPAGPAGRRIHVVKPGETLSGIAHQYLGSAARFGEIFAANTDRLARPESIRVGMELVIPAAEGNASEVPATAEMPTVSREEPAEPTIAPDGPALAAPAASAVPAATAAEATSQEPTATPVENAGKMFVPARRAPFMPGRYRPPAAAAAK